MHRFANDSFRMLFGNFLDLDSSKIYYEECGTGPETVVQIHDGIAHSAV